MTIEEYASDLFDQEEAVRELQKEVNVLHDEYMSALRVLNEEWEEEKRLRGIYERAVREWQEAERENFLKGVV